MNNPTERLYYTDSYCRGFRAHVVNISDNGLRVVLDRTAFYPASGGQPHDIGRIGPVEVVEVVDEPEGIVHVVSSPVEIAEADCEIDWNRRFDHMQQHTGQHLLSAAIAELLGIATVSFHMGAATSTIDLACASLTLEQLRAAEERANRIVQENRSVSIAFEDASMAEGLRKASDRLGSLRIVSIDGLDRSACGGTHVHATGEIGAILLRSTEKIRGNLRLEFLCGSRAIRRARADYDALAGSARLFSAPLDDLPSLVATQVERLKESDKIRQRLVTELAGYRGRSLHAETPATGQNIRLHTRMVKEGPFPDELRSEANGFVSQGRAVFVAVAERPAAVLLATSADSGVHSGNVLRSALADFSGKGGGSAQMAQGSFEGRPEALLEKLLNLLIA